LNAKINCECFKNIFDLSHREYSVCLAGGHAGQNRKRFLLSLEGDFLLGWPSARAKRSISNSSANIWRPSS